MNLLVLAVFATIDESAIDALRHAAATCNPRYECGGVVRKVRGGFEASELIISAKPFGVDLEQLYAPNVVADFHTHICSIHNKPFADFFSGADALVNQGLHTVGYMLSLCDRNIRRYDPSQDDRDDEEVDFHSGRVIYLTSGHIVGWAPALPAVEETLMAATGAFPPPGEVLKLSAEQAPPRLNHPRHRPGSSAPGRGAPSLTLSATSYSGDSRWSSRPRTKAASH